MSDEEEGPSYVKKQKVIHYGSLEDKEKARMAASNKTAALLSTAIEAGKEAGHINITEGW